MKRTTYDIYRHGRRIGTATLQASDPESARRQLVEDNEWPRDIAVRPRHRSATTPCGVE